MQGLQKEGLFEVSHSGENQLGGRFKDYIFNEIGKKLTNAIKDYF